LHKADEKQSRWETSIIGPSGTHFEGGLFVLDVRFPFDYPHHPQRICFKTKVYHPNVDDEGRISLDALGAMWSPVWTLQKCMFS
jgi:ubiquitin-protein ligase